MTDIWQALVKAGQLLLSFDPEVMGIAGRSIWISLSATLIAALICLPVGALIHFNRFNGKRALVTTIQTLYSLPTVVVGLLVVLFLSRAGPLGSLGLLFTPTAMVIGQSVLIMPILLGLTISAFSGVDKTVLNTATSLGASGSQTAVLVMREARFAVMAAVFVAFGRAISEVGVAIMVGGNIRGFTRVITTAISLESSKGDFELSLALGVILLIIALVINVALNRLQQRRTGAD